VTARRQIGLQYFASFVALKQQIDRPDQFTSDTNKNSRITNYSFMATEISLMFNLDAKENQAGMSLAEELNRLSGGARGCSTQHSWR
jgi:hypothetical protein